MILVGNQRGGGADLAAHLLKDENEHVTVHELRGFVASDLPGALQEVQAVARATRCKQYLFSLSLNPPQTECVSVEAFERAADKIEDKLGLTDQPRAFVFHEKHGRRHAHVVWSRIDGDEIKAINLPFTKRKLMDISKSLYLEHGWQMPDGVRDPALSNPLNFSQAEWQQALRTDRDPREIKQAFRECYERSDSGKAFSAALKQHGFYLAKGDRRGVVAVDYVGEVYSFTRWAGINTKDLKARLGDMPDLPSVEQTKQSIRDDLTPNLKAMLERQKRTQRAERERVRQQAREVAAKHNEHRAVLNRQQRERLRRETMERQRRYRPGLSGMLDRVTGKAAKIKALNECETWDSFKRDQGERDRLIFDQLEQRQGLQQTFRTLCKTHQERRKELHALIADARRVEGRKAIKRAQTMRMLEKNRSRDGPGLER